SFAPKIQTRPYGTRPPKIFRSRTRGLEYSMVIVFPSANWHMAVAGGLNCANPPNPARAGTKRTTRPMPNPVFCHSMKYPPDRLIITHNEVTSATSQAALHFSFWLLLSVPGLSDSPHGFRRPDYRRD